MDFLVTPVVLSHFPETNDPALHRSQLDALLPLGEHGPVLPHAETPGLAARRHLTRTKHVEDEDAAGEERVVDAPEKARQAQFLVLSVEKIVEDLAYRRDGPTTWDLDLEERSNPELGLGYLFARELDHGFGDVDPQDLVARVYELARPQTATATEVYDEAIVYPVLAQDLQYAWRRSEGELGVADVVDVGDVLPVPPRRIRASRGYLSSL